MPSDPRRGIAWALAAAVASGFFVIPWKLANEQGEPANSAFALLGFAALFNTVLGLGRRGGNARTRLGRYELAVAGVMAVLSLLGNLASASAIERLSASLTNVLLRADVIVVALMAWAALGERVDRRYWLGAALAGLGLVVLRAPGSADAIDPRGTLLAGGAVLCFSGLTVVTRMAIHRIDPVRVNAIRLWMCLPLWLVLAGGLGPLAEMGRSQLLWAALAAFAGPFAARLCMILSARHVDARTTTLGVLSAPVISVPLERIFLGRSPSPHEWIGGAILMLGIAVPLLRRSRAGDDSR